MFDLVIKNGYVIDGTGAVGKPMDIGIRDGKIAALGTVEGERVLDARGFTVTPGFLDIHRHGDAAVFRPGFGRGELRQGLTTVVHGACGLSVAPFGEAHRQEILHYLLPVVGTLPENLPTQTMEAYLTALRQQKLPLNVGMLVGAGIVRADLFGYGAEEPEDYGKIHRQLENALQAGAIGVSLGLGYAPECFYSTEGLIHALEPLRNSDIPIAVHMREEGDKVCQALEEMLTVAGALHCPLHISHLKAMGRRNWHKRIPQALERIRLARQEGLDVSCDAYPYEAGSTQLLHILPPEFLEGGTEVVSRRLREVPWRERLRERIREGRDFDNIAQLVGWGGITISALQLPQYQCLIGKTVEEAAELLHLDPVDCVCQVLSDEHCGVTMIDRINSEEDISLILREDYASLISDATYPTTGLPHPRVYASVTRFLEHFVGELGILPLHEAVRRLTDLPARSMRIPGKGRLAVGFDADINIFKPEELHALATFQNPRQESRGMDTVIVNGQPVILHGQWCDACPGRVL